MDIDSFEKLAQADPRKIEIVTGRKYPFGNQIKESLQSLPPKVQMELKETDCLKQGKVKVLITLTRLSGPVQSSRRHYADMVCKWDVSLDCFLVLFFCQKGMIGISFLQVVGSEEDNLIHFHEKIRLFFCYGIHQMYFKQHNLSLFSKFLNVKI